ncbi:hypothetical protein RD792_014395 [Penstemon davidsonii]|uniref:Uncharacterized protein n=1 Tax=Penstemon davidsonii TaxID=160366 RepID=A0ABR0CQ25_9LAMI|nr:hypothetical protein RD792_014395 [Penstemon davidsonii]
MASSGQVANLSKMMLFFTSTLICRIAFAKKYDEEESKRLRFDKLMIENQAMEGGFFVSDYLPLFCWVGKLSGMMSRLDKSFKELDEFYQELIDEHLDLNSPKSNRTGQDNEPMNRLVTGSTGRTDRVTDRIG